MLKRFRAREVSRCAAPARYLARRGSTRRVHLLALVLLLASPVPARAQLDESCVVSARNRFARVQRDGSWIIWNVPLDGTLLRARATCTTAGTSTGGTSDFLVAIVNGPTPVASFEIGPIASAPVSLELAAASTTLTEAGATTQLATTATLSDGSTQDVTRAAASTAYFSANLSIATVSQNGSVTALSAGSTIVSAINQGDAGAIDVAIE